MKKTACPFLLLLLALHAAAVGWDQLDSFYHRIDNAIARSSEFIAIREARISNLRAKLNKSANERDRLNLSFLLFEEYKSYQNDSAVSYLTKAISLAVSLKDGDMADYCRSLLAFQYSSSGMYTEAFAMLDTQKQSQLKGKALAQYYISSTHLYGEIAYYTSQPSLQRQFQAKADSCRRLLFQVLKSDDDVALQYREMEYYNRKNFAKALEINDRRMKNLRPDDHQYAVVAFYRYLDYYLTKDTLSMKYWLTQSVLNDIENAVMDQGAMWELTHFLIDGGDVERAYRYIGFATDCANRFNSRMRNWQITSTFARINKIYEQQQNKTNARLRGLVGGISLLSLILLAMSFYSHRQHKLLATAQKLLKQRNHELTASNGQLSDVVKQLNKTVKLLDDSNKVKEEYVGRFLYMCSIYIDRMTSYRKQVIKKLKNRQYDTLYQDTRRLEADERETEELYQNFDSAFLHLYPNFVEEFNRLLRPEERIQSSSMSLTTPLRIFALIRLGIDDSGKIAEFLHYSVNTIYNYRARIKNGALGERELFEDQVKKIGIDEISYNSFDKITKIISGDKTMLIEYGPDKSRILSDIQGVRKYYVDNLFE